MIVENNPSLYHQGDGAEFFLVVHQCQSALKIDEDHKLRSYTSATDCVDSEVNKELFEEAAAKISINSKMMTQGSSDPEDYRSSKRTTTYFTQRIMTNAISSFG